MPSGIAPPAAPQEPEVTMVVALGGNALTRPGERGTAAEQRANLRRSCEALRAVLGDGDLVVTHGNGPQVGNELLRHERAADEVPALPLYLAVAQTQAEIGALIESELAPVAARPVVCLLTHVRVDADDPAFAEPTKPVGPFYDEARAKELEVVELEAVRALVGTGAIAVACGGGGIPVTRHDGRLSGIDAVIDKDRASALLATELRAQRLLILTDVPAVYRGFGTSREEELRRLTVDEVQALAPELTEGSIKPKVEAAAEFAAATGGEALITSAEALGAALAGEAGTRVR